jgi:hypothetical protein
VRSEAHPIGCYRRSRTVGCREVPQQEPAAPLKGWESACRKAWPLLLEATKSHTESTPISWKRRRCWVVAKDLHHERLTPKNYIYSAA